MLGMQATWLIWGKKEVVNNINKIIIEIVHNHQSIVKIKYPGSTIQKELHTLIATVISFH